MTVTFQYHISCYFFVKILNRNSYLELIEIFNRDRWTFIDPHFIRRQYLLYTVKKMNIDISTGNTSHHRFWGIKHDANKSSFPANFSYRRYR